MSIIGQESNFFGRSEILSLLKKRYLGLKEGYRQNVALLGNRFVGKTTILYKFLSDLEEEDGIKIYVDLDNRDFQYFASKFIGSLLYSYAECRGLSPQDDVKLLIESVKEYIPQTVKEIKKIQHELSRNKYTDAYQDLLNLPEVFTNESNKFCILVLEEFQNLEEFSIPNVFQALGKKIMTQKKIFYVVTSSYPEIAKKILSEDLSLLFGNFEMINVDLFDLKASHEFIDYGLKQLKMKTGLKKFLIDFTGGHPLYLNLILKEIVSLSTIHQQTDVFSPLLVQSIENTIFDQWGVLSRHFELIINNICSLKGNRIAASVLIALANNRCKMKELAKTLEIKQSLVSPRISRLIEMGIVEKNAGYLYLKDKLFRYWIKYVFQKRLLAVDSSHEKLKKDFLEEVSRSIGDFKVSAQKDLSSRIVELFHCFDNDAFHLNGRKYKIPAFNHVESVKSREGSSRDYDVIKATSSDGFWFIMLKKESFCENDVQAFLAQSRKSSKRPNRCVMISLADLEQNARLKALQERFWIWNENEVNALLNLYDKPYIV